MTLRGLYLITPNWDDTKQLLQTTELALSAGVALLQYRHKTASASLRLEQASALQKLCQQYDVPLIINDFVDLCMHLNADGVHVGGTDISVLKARALLGKRKIVGASCYADLLLTEHAVKQGASYVALGGFYPSVVKQYPVSTLPSILTVAKRDISLPIVVIGGMTVDLARPLVQHGADMVAVITSVYQSSNPFSAVKELNSLFH